MKARLSLSNKLFRIYTGVLLTGVLIGIGICIAAYKFSDNRVIDQSKRSNYEGGILLGLVQNKHIGQSFTDSGNWIGIIP